MRNYGARLPMNRKPLYDRAINRGEAIPEPVKQLPVMGRRPLNCSGFGEDRRKSKQKFGLKGASV